MGKNARTWLAAAAVTAAVGSLAGCGGGFAEQDVQAIKDAAVKDMKEVSSLRMNGSIDQQGTKLGMDLQLDSEGQCQGTMDIDGAQADIISTGDETFFKGDTKFWEATTGSPQVAKQVQSMVGDKWAKMPEGGGSLGGICDLDQLLSQLDEKGDDKSESTKGEEGEIDGQDAIEVVTDKDDKTTSTWVATDDDAHHILKMEVEGGDTPGEFTFSEYDDEVNVEAPADDEVADLSQM